MTEVIHVNEMQDGDVYIGRPSKWGNPYRIGRDGTREECIASYWRSIKDDAEFVAEVRRELKGKRLACYCAPKRCHGLALAYLADTDEHTGLHA